MEYLLLAILFSSLFPISFKIAEKFHFNPQTSIVLNYMFGSLFSLITFILTFQETILMKPLLISLVLGIPTGVIYFLALILYQKSISAFGLSISALFMKIAMIVPVILIIIIFNERPNVYQYIGIFLALIAIVILNGGIKQLKGLTPTLFLLFIFSGLGDFSNKVFETLGDMDYRFTFIFSTFVTASVLGYIRNRKLFLKNINRTNVISGFFIGIFNTLSTYFIVLTFSVMKGSIALVIINTSIILLVSLVGLILFREQLKRNEAIAFVISLAAIILVSMH